MLFSKKQNNNQTITKLYSANKRVGIKLCNFA
jgi:hypothetical protein